ncbi:histidine kinase [Flammeovirgaceae bacterium SG7u.111]|nr:histidine kinase [Flammeovirgaceae bacterium SG7u.132]WPO36091.1 histidine kinase [Flammeovirgaceae bacterium SG7u.111]
MFDVARYKKRPVICDITTKYTPVSILLRFVVVSVIAILSIEFIDRSNLEFTGKDDATLLHYVIITIAYYILSEGLIVIDNVLEYFFPIPIRLRLRIAIQFLLTLLLIVLVYLFTEVIAFSYFHLIVHQSAFYMGIALGLVFVTLFSSTLLLSRFTEKWVNAQKHIDDLKREKLKMDYSVLQDQLNPHFLFNNLSVLKSLIIYDGDAAVKFTENFTDVYRYVLQSKEAQVVDFQEEYEFINSYVGLHKERIGKGLDVRLSVSEAAFSKEIAPMTLQLLIENAIKHNITSKVDPLKIDVYTENGHIVVKNNLQLKESSYSTKTGLSNLVKRYQLLTSKEILIDDSNEFFIVKVPLL